MTTVVMFSPADAEVLAHAMEWIKEQKGKIHVIDIGYAFGEDGLLLAYAGADRVTFNAVSSHRVAFLKTQLARLPQTLKSKCEVVEEDCLELLNKKPELKERIHLIVCRNFLSCINNPDVKRFFSMINSLLVPGGKAIFTTNSPHDVASLNKEPVEKYLGHIYFNVVRVKFYDSLTKEFRVLFQGAAPIDKSLYKHETEEIDLYKRCVFDNPPSDKCENNWEKINPLLKDKMKRNN